VVRGTLGVLDLLVPVLLARALRLSRLGLGLTGLLRGMIGRRRCRCLRLAGSRGCGRLCLISLRTSVFSVLVRLLVCVILGLRVLLVRPCLGVLDRASDEIQDLQDPSAKEAAKTSATYHAKLVFGRLDTRRNNVLDLRVHRLSTMLCLDPTNTNLLYVKVSLILQTTNA
jgi:hypothetical protein